MGWTGKLTGLGTASDRARFNFIMNKSWDYTMKRISDTSNEVAFSNSGYSTSVINLNHGTYNISFSPSVVSLSILLW